MQDLFKLTFQPIDVIFFNMSDTFSDWQKQNQFLNQEKLKNPALFKRAPILDTPEILKIIGIEIFDKNRPAVYLRLWPQDFIVEEISGDGRIHTIDYLENTSFAESEGQTIYADLAKIGMSTFDVVEEIEKTANIDRKLIGYAGIKDRDAITSQWLSFRNTPIDVVKSINSPSFFLKNIYQGKGAIQVGNLEGNQFTLVLRGTEDFDSGNIEASIKSYEKDGFWNFFYSQRFGTPRLVSHYLGLLLLKKEYEQALKVLFTFQSNTEIDYYLNLRKIMSAKWGDWQGIYKLLEPLGYSFRRELKILTHLIEKPSDFLGALRLFPDQVQFWIFAYASYLFNRKLSELIKQGKVPEQLPLLLSRNPNDWAIYKKLTDADGVKMPSPVFRDFPLIQIRDRAINTRQKFKFHGFKLAAGNPKIGVMSFTLPKGSYATTLLAHLFTVSSSIPVLPGIDPDVVDSKKILGRGSVEPLTVLFKNVINSKLEVKEDNLEELA